MSSSAEGIGWHHTVPPGYVGGRRLSIVVPARNVAYCLPTVLDALEAQAHGRCFEVIVVDDASTDDTAKIIATHPVVTTGLRLQARHGAAKDGPDLAADHRVTWQPPVDTPLLYSGITVREPIEGRPLEHTREFRDLGYGRTYYDWDLPRMVVTALLAVPRGAVLNVGGFEAEFGRIGWGMEDTYLGACLIATGLLVVPVRQAAGLHLDPPDAAEQWQHKLATWPTTLVQYRALLNETVRHGRGFALVTSMNALLKSCEVLR